MSNPAQQERCRALLEEHKRILFKVAHAYSRTPADRDDLVQEMALQTWRSFGRYDDGQRFSTWLYRVCLNVAISFYRGQLRRDRTLVPIGEAGLEVPAASGEESRQLEENLQRLQQFIARLPELDRALVLLYLDGNSHGTIAEVLGISTSNVGTKIGRIKQRLRRDWPS